MRSGEVALNCPVSYSAVGKWARFLSTVSWENYGPSYWNLHKPDSLIMENQMEKIMDDEMETVIIYGRGLRL